MAEDLNIAGGMPPAFRNNLLPTGCDSPAASAASSLLCPEAIAFQNLFCSSRPAADGRPGDGNGTRPDRAERRLETFIATSNFLVLRRPHESALAAPIAMVHEPAAMNRSPIARYLLSASCTKPACAVREARQPTILRA